MQVLEGVLIVPVTLQYISKEVGMTLTLLLATTGPRLHLEK